MNQGADTIQGLRIADEGTLAKLPNSTRALSGSGVGGRPGGVQPVQGGAQASEDR